MESGQANSATRQFPHIVNTTRGLRINDKLLHVIILASITAVAVLMRVFFLNTLGYNSDEAVYAGQGAAIAQAPILKDIFPVFRAHPLLFQVTLALFFSFGVNDLLGRLVSVAVGVFTVILVYLLGRKLYGRRAGFIAALIMAFMPYHVVVTRQVLLDGPLVFCTTLTLLLLAKFADTEKSKWLIAAGVGMGLTFLAKETGILMLGAIYVFLAITPQIRVRLWAVIVSLLLTISLMAVLPLSVNLAGGGSGKTTGNYLVWQLFRRPNHTWDFYLTVVPPAIGLLVIGAALAGLWLLRKQGSWREKMLLAWIIVPVVFFQLWPTKGFQYLLPIAPAIAILAARTLSLWPTNSITVRNWKIPRYLPGTVATFLVLLSLFISSWQRISPSQSDTFLAGSGGVPGGRESGMWVAENVPSGATFMTIGPSMANIIKFYGHRESLGLSVSPNPLHRNPSYEPVINPDFQIRTGELQYLVWDSFSAERSTFFSDKLLWYVNKYNGRAVHSETVQVTTDDGAKVEKPVIIIYEVHP